MKTEQTIKVYPADIWTRSDMNRIDIERQLQEGWRVVSMAFRPSNNSENCKMFVVYEREIETESENENNIS